MALVTSAPTLSMSHAQTAPQSWDTHYPPPLSITCWVPPPGKCLGAAPAWPLAGISPAVAAVSLGPCNSSRRRSWWGWPRPLSVPHPKAASVCNLVLPALPCLPWAAGPQQTLCRSESSKEGRGEGDWHGVGEGQAQKGRLGHPWQTGLIQLHRRSGPASAGSGGGASSRLQTHTLRCLQLFMGTWKSCLPASSKLAASCRELLVAPLAGPQRGPG